MDYSQVNDRMASEMHMRVNKSSAVSLFCLGEMPAKCRLLVQVEHWVQRVIPLRGKTGLDSKWKLDFNWLKIMEDGQGMLGKFCCKLNCRSQKVPLGHAVWVDLPCKSFVRSSVMLTSQRLK